MQCVGNGWPRQKRREVSKFYSNIRSQVLVREDIARSVDRLMDKNLPAIDTFYLAVSGGHDSMALLEVFYRLKKQGREMSLVVLHVNHNLRGQESDLDEQFVVEEAHKREIPVHSFKIQWKKGEIKSQENCRKKREAFFASFVKEGDGKVVFAHHLDDQAETLLMRLVRGTGIRGLAGMAVCSNWKFRPLLAFTKNDINEYMRKQKISWREDSSNSSLKYERNWLRHKVMLPIEERRPGFSKRLGALAIEASQIQSVGFAKETKFEFEGMRFYRISKKTMLDPSLINREFNLSREHTQNLLALFQRGFGQLNAEGIDFYLSAGILRETKKRWTGQEQKTIKDWKNILGEWNAKYGGLLTRQQLMLSSERSKKLYQEKAIPIFFRDLIPFISMKQKPRLVTPDILEQSEVIAAGVSCELSPLGNWFFNLSVSIDGQA